jgi:hypothetical protein
MPIGRRYLLDDFAERTSAAADGPHIRDKAVKQEPGDGRLLVGTDHRRRDRGQPSRLYQTAIRRPTTFRDEAGGRLVVATTNTDLLPLT